MRIQATAVAICAAILALVAAGSSEAQLSIDVESGAVFSGYNDIRIPGDTGTDVSLKDDLEPETEVFYRVRLEYTLADRHTFSALYSANSVRGRGVPVRHSTQCGLHIQLISSDLPLRIHATRQAQLRDRVHGKNQGRADTY